MAGLYNLGETAIQTTAQRWTGVLANGGDVWVAEGGPDAIYFLKHQAHRVSDEVHASHTQMRLDMPDK